MEDLRFLLMPNKVITLTNQKGGCAKSTTTVNLATRLAKDGYKVLMVDIDPQANGTFMLGVDPLECKYTVYDVLLNVQNGYNASMAIIPTKEGVDLLPSHIDLAAAELELAGKVRRESLLNKALAPVKGNYDYIFIDTPPSLGLFTLNALAASDGFIIPVQAHPMAYRATFNLMATVELVKQEVNPKLEFLGILVTMYQKGNKVCRMIDERVRAQFPGQVFSTTIPYNIVIAESAEAQESIYLYEPRATSAEAYTDFTTEFINKYAA